MSQKRSKECKCNEHNSIVGEDESPKILNLETGKKVKVSTRDLLVERQVIGPKTKYICEKCVDHFETTSCLPKKAKGYDLKVLINDLKCNNMAEEDITSIAYAVGENISKNMCQPDVHYSNHIEVSTVSYEINRYDKKLVSFLHGFSSTASCSETKVLSVLENIYSLTDCNFVGPMCFSQNLLSYYYTGSRNIVDLNNQLLPSGSYNTMISFFKTSCHKSASLPDGDGVFFFDNNQILTKRWNIVYNCKAYVSAVTTVLFMIPPVETNLQNNPSLSPYIWLNEITDRHTRFSEERLDNYFRNYRNNFIESVLGDVYKEQTLENGNYFDKVDMIKPGEKVKTTIIHERVANRNTDGGISFKPVHKDPYCSVKSNVEGKCETHLMDPIFVNPCSYQAVSSVFDNILQINDGKREWIAMGCDGLPYILQVGSKLIEKKYKCQICEFESKGKEDFQTHVNIHQNEEIVINDCKKYGKILLIPGLGHYEINYTKALFKLLWTVCLCSLAKLMGFKSLKALQNCQKALNHHKSWQLLNILFQSNSRELVLPYVRHCLQIKETPSLESFYRYIQGSGENYIFMFKCTFNFLLALKLFRAGVRRCNEEAVKAGMKKLSGLFYGLNMTTYMEIDLRRILLEEKCPDELRPLYFNLSCMSRSGNESKAEGGDIILEAFNRKVKMFMPPGSGTTERWLRAYRNLPFLEKMKQDTPIHPFKDDPDYDGFRTPNDETEIMQWRKQLRSSGYLNDNGVHKSMEGQELDKDLINFDDKCNTNRDRYCTNFPAYFKCENVFITPDDRSKYHDINSKTKKEIAVEIESVIESIRQYENGDIIDILLDTWGKCKKGKKSEYLEFYKEVVQALEEVTTIDERNDSENVENLEQFGEEEVEIEQEEVMDD